MDEPERDQFLLKEAKHDLQGVFDELDIERSPFDLQRELTRKYGATYGARAVRMAFYDFWGNYPSVVERRNARRNRRKWELVTHEEITPITRVKYNGRVISLEADSGDLMDPF